jgi:hypothetical protein
MTKEKPFMEVSLVLPSHVFFCFVFFDKEKYISKNRQYRETSKKMSLSFISCTTASPIDLLGWPEKSHEICNSFGLV